METLESREAQLARALELLHEELASLRRALAAGHTIEAESDMLHRAGALIKALLPG